MHFIQTAAGLASQAFDGKCRSYDPGHAPHQIQLRKAFESSRVPAAWIGIEAPNTLFLLINEVVTTFSNHHPETIQDLMVIHPNSELAWVEDFRILVLQTSKAEGFAFNLSSEPIQQCGH
jgi:hypothetical protein